MFSWFRREKNREAIGSVDGQVREWMVATQWSARARWVSHVIDFLGDPTQEWSPNLGRELPQRPEFIVLEFGPREDRDYWTYLTAGLALVPQAPPGPMPHLEILACSPVRDARVAEFLFMLSQDVATALPEEAAFKAFDLWGAEYYGLKHFLLAPAREPAELLEFPNREKRKEDERYLLAAIGNLTGTMELNLLQLVPLTYQEWRTASERGSTTLLDELCWDTQPKSYGWGAIRPVEEER